jgi:hypothetical protein
VTGHWPGLARLKQTTKKLRGIANKVRGRAQCKQRCTGHDFQATSARRKVGSASALLPAYMRSSAGRNWVRRLRRLGKKILRTNQQEQLTLQLPRTTCRAGAAG